MLLISSCLVGINCRYNGTSTIDCELKKMVENGTAIDLCPETLIGMPIPRESCEIHYKSAIPYVKSLTGVDYSNFFHRAAEKTLEICKRNNIHKAILQSRSPSCGFGLIYDGSFSNNLVCGHGITADLLNKNGIEILNEKNWRQASK